jgi:hypothetical protein
MGISTVPSHAIDVGSTRPNIPERSFEPDGSTRRTIFAANDSPAGVDVLQTLRIAATNGAGATERVHSL